MKMKSVQFYAPQDIRYEEVIVKAPQKNEVLVKVKAALTCGTDVKTYHRGHPKLIKTFPSGFGHEFAGIIEKVGENVKGFSVGDRVVAANSAPCGECYYCKIEEYNLCENLDLLNGAYAEYITIPKRIVEKNLIKIKDSTPFELAAFAEPLANVVHGVEKTVIKPGQTVGIVGIGPIGLMFARLAKLKGANVIVAGRNPLKLELAKTFAQADIVIDLTNETNPKEAFLKHTTEHKGLDVAVECVGLPEIWEQMFDLVRKGGTIHLFGGCKAGSKIQVDTTRLHYDGLKILSVFHHTPEYFRKALEYIESGEVDVKQLISIELPLEKTQEAMEMHSSGKIIKALLRPEVM